VPHNPEPRTQNPFLWDQPFDEAVKFFLDKTKMPRGEFDKLAAGEKSRAFTAAYVYKADELQRVFDGVLAALEKGKTLNDFKKATGDILTKPWHRETVFRTNVLSAYGRGHWEQAQAVKAMRPYARYSAVMDGRTRPRHAVLHGLVYPLDHEFWKTYWPPWDYNCRCAAITLSQGEIDREGLKVRRDLPQGVAPRNNFVSPAQGGDWTPDLGKYTHDLRNNVENSLQALQPKAWQPFENIADITQWAEKSFKSWNKSLVPEEVETLKLYQSSSYRTWNEALRENAVTDEMRPWINALDQALNKTSIDRDIVVFRGFTESDILKKFDRLTGSTIDEKGFCSTTLDKGVSEKFGRWLEDEGLTPILAEIRVPMGTKGAYLEGTRLLQPYEYEILLPRKTKFKVINAWIDDRGSHHLLLEVIE